MKFARPKQNGHRLWLSVSKVCLREISLTGQTNGQREINRRLLHALHYTGKMRTHDSSGQVIHVCLTELISSWSYLQNQVLVVCMVILYYYCVTNILFFIFRLLQSYNCDQTRPSIGFNQFNSDLQ